MYVSLATGPLGGDQLPNGGHDRLRLNRSHLVGYLDDIQQRELVQRDRDPHDRRRQRVALTSSGCDLTRKLQEIARRTQEEFLEVLTEPERQSLVAMLRRVLIADDEALGRSGSS